VRHAILGAGGVGSLLGGALARAGREVVLLLRPETLARHPPRLRVESAVLGDFEADVATASELDREVDVLWVSPKAPHLEEALELAPPDRVGAAVVVPLLNGVDHVGLLRARYERVLAAAIRVESERVEPGVVHQPTAFARVDLAPGPKRDPVAEELRAAGLQVELGIDEATVMWEKLALLAPLALTTTAAGATGGAVQDSPEWSERLFSCHREAVAVGVAEGATLDGSALDWLLHTPLGEMRTSMQKDFDARRPLELDAIAGPVVRGGRKHGLATPATEELIRLVERRVETRSESSSK
jgi:2-dehydropantoate 2-reductase